MSTVNPPLRPRSPSPLSTAEFPLGATVLPHATGVGFRVWAPHADLVSVVGDFNHWDKATDPLRRENEGTWSAIVTRAKEGSEYRYALRRGATEFTRIDPRALKVTNSIGNGVVFTPGAGGAGFSTQWDGAFVHPVRSLLTTPCDEDRNLDELVAALRHRYEDDPFRRVVYSESHDEVANGRQRVPSEVDPEEADSYAARKRSMLGAVLTFTAPGIPMIFHGQEFLEDEWFRDEVPLDWAKLARYGSIHAAYRDLARLRSNAPGHTAGLSGRHIEINHVNHPDKVLAYRRWREGGPGDDVMVVINLSTRRFDRYRLGVPAAGTWHTRLNTDSKAYPGDFDDHGVAEATATSDPRDGYDFTIEIALAPYSALLLSQDEATRRSR